MKLRTQILAIGIAGAVLAAALGAIGVSGASRTGHVVDEAIAAGEALRAGQLADMMHDAVRGDAQFALSGANDKNVEQIAEAEKALAGHAEKFEQALAKLQSTDLDPASRAALAVVQPQVKTYLAAAATAVQAAKAEGPSAKQTMPAVQAAFSALEKDMGALVDQIEKRRSVLDDQVKASVEQVRTQTVLA